MDEAALTAGPALLFAALARKGLPEPDSVGISDCIPAPEASAEADDRA